jgi:hypothetical protein
MYGTTTLDEGRGLMYGTTTLDGGRGLMYMYGTTTLDGGRGLMYGTTGIGFIRDPQLYLFNSDIICDLRIFKIIHCCESPIDRFLNRIQVRAVHSRSSPFHVTVQHIACEC